MKQMELDFFENILIESKQTLLSNIKKVTAEIEESKGVDLKDEGDIASASGNLIINDAIIMQQKKELDEIEYAILKLKRGSYGICEMCEDPIGTPRLKAKPFAKYCIVCREIVEKENKKKDSK